MAVLSNIRTGQQRMERKRGGGREIESMRKILGSLGEIPAMRSSMKNMAVIATSRKLMLHNKISDHE